VLETAHTLEDLNAPEWRRLADSPGSLRTPRWTQFASSGANFSVGERASTKLESLTRQRLNATARGDRRSWEAIVDDSATRLPEHKRDKMRDRMTAHRKLEPVRRIYPPEGEANPTVKNNTECQNSGRLLGAPTAEMEDH
jgi:hypothetical protein